MRSERSGEAGERPSTTSYGGGGALPRDLGTLLQPPTAVGLQGEVHRPQKRLDLDRPAAVRVPKLDGTVDQELDAHVVAGELDGLDLADPDAGDADLVVGLETAGLVEGGVVGVAASDQRQVLGPEGGP